jgi:hypothetical protein
MFDAEEHRQVLQILLGQAGEQAVPFEEGLVNGYFGWGVLARGHGSIGVGG